MPALTSPYVLPILIVAFTGLGPLAQVYRAGLAEVSRADYFRTALAKGADPDTALEAQGGRYARLGLSAALTAEAGWVVGGTAVVEVVFGLPGLGTFLVDSIAVRAYRRTPLWRRVWAVVAASTLTAITGAVVAIVVSAGLVFVVVTLTDMLRS